MLNRAMLTKLGTLWLGTEDSFQGLMESFSKMEAADEQLKINAFIKDDEDADEGTHHLLQIVNEVAVITVHGSMVSGSTGSWGAYWGIIGYDDIRNALIMAAEQGAKEVLFDWDTPGGQVKGIMELSDFIKLQDMKTTSFTGGMAASGGVWLATAADTFYAARMAEIGSVGVLAVVAELTEMYKEAGVNIKVFKSTPLKAAGNSYEKRTPEVEAQIQKNIDDTHAFFVKEIAENQGLTEEFVSENIANGKVWFAAEANQLNLIDGIKTFDEVFLALLRETTDNTNNFQQIQDTDMAKRKVISEEAAAAIASGVPVDKALEQAEEPKELTAEEQAAKVAEDEEAAAKVAEEEAAAKVAEDEAAAADKSASDNSAIVVLKGQVAELQAEQVDLKVKLTLSESKATAMESAESGLKEVVAVAIQRAYVAVGSVAPDMAGLLAMDTSALLTQHATASSLLAKRYGTGGQITVDVNEDEDASVAAAAKLTNQHLLQQARI